MNRIPTLKRQLVWLKRIKHRCGHGVHSPFAFDFITSVIYEKAPYYSYNTIETSGKHRIKKPEEDYSGSRKVNRLLFRLVNRYQPKTIIEAGPHSISSLYLQEGCKTGRLINITASGSLNEFLDGDVDFLYIPYGHDIESVRNIVYHCLSKVGPCSVFVVGGVGSDSRMKALWGEIKNDIRVYITFDLYDVGIVLFDDKKIKQHYIVNF